MGLQEGYVNGLFGGLGSLLGLTGVVLSMRMDWGFLGVTSALLVAPVIVQGLNTIFLFRSKPWTRPKRDNWHPRQARELFGIGIMFFVLQVAMAVGYATDNIVISRYLGAEAVTEYAVPQKLFGLATMGLGLLLMPLWPAYREASSGGDGEWVRQTFRRSLILGLGFSLPAAAFLFVFGGNLVRFWTSGVVTVSGGLCLALACFVAVNGLITPIAMFLNGMGVVRFQVVCAISMASTNLALSIYLVRSIGVAGVVWGTVIAQVLCVLVPCSMYIPSVVRRLSTQTSADGQPTLPQSA